MELATACDERDAPCSAHEAKQAGRWRAWCDLIETTCALSELEAAWERISDDHRRGDMPAGWLNELSVIYADHRNILMEQE